MLFYNDVSNYADNICDGDTLLNVRKSLPIT